MALTLSQCEIGRQISSNNVLCCILGNQCITRILELNTEQLTAFIGNNVIYKKKNTDSKIIHMANCNTCKKRSLDVEWVILIRYYYQKAKQEHYINLKIDLLDNLLTFCHTQIGRGNSIQLYLNWGFGCIDDPDHYLGSGEVSTLTRTQGDSLDSLLILFPTNWSMLPRLTNWIVCCKCSGPIHWSLDKL